MIQDAATTTGALETLRALSEAAWQGPWHVDEYGLQSIWSPQGYVGSLSPHSAAFAVAAVAYVWSLLAAGVVPETEATT